MIKINESLSKIYSDIQFYLSEGVILVSLEDLTLFRKLYK